MAGWAVLALWCCLLPVPQIDPALSQAMRQLDPAITDFFRTLTVLAESRWTLLGLGPLALLLLGLGRWRADRPWGRRCGWWGWALLFIVAAVALSGLVVDLIKPLIGRGRPKLLDQYGFYGLQWLTFRSDFYSFPSGHAATAVSWATALVLLWPRGRWLWLVLAALLVASRVVVNAHFLSDVMAGSLIGWATTWWLRHAVVRWPGPARLWGQVAAGSTKSA